MKLTKKIMMLMVACIISVSAFAQVEETDNPSMHDDGGENYYAPGTDSTAAAKDSDEEIDSETVVMDAETVEAQTAVDEINDILDQLTDAEEDAENPATRHYAVYSDSPSIVPYSKDYDATISQKFDEISLQGYRLVRQTVFNTKRQAWDFIYERLYNEEGNLIHFVRRYNTFNSGCAEVAFERSEYFYDSKGELVKKTYDIYDSNNNVLDFDDCWMERETYNTYSHMADFDSMFPFPQEETPAAEPAQEEE